uniref:Uncharacterized protein n=2 Tax=Arundo donax TaxID=35708 RepID=A0A0A9CK88_ARUDO
MSRNDDMRRLATCAPRSASCFASALLILSTAARTMASAALSETTTTLLLFREARQSRMAATSSSRTWWSGSLTLASWGGLVAAVLLGLAFGLGVVAVLHTACSTLAFTWVLENPASRMTRLTLGSSRMETTSCSSSILTASTGCCWLSTEPRRWCACARLNAATSALERDGG